MGCQGACLAQALQLVGGLVGLLHPLEGLLPDVLPRGGARGARVGQNGREGTHEVACEASRTKT